MGGLPASKAAASRQTTAVRAPNRQAARQPSRTSLVSQAGKYPQDIYPD